MISYIYIYDLLAVSYKGLLGWPIINMMTIYVCICVFLFCYTICFFFGIYIPSVPRYLKIVKFIYIHIYSKFKKKHWCGGGVLTEWFRIYIYDLLAVSYEGCWGGPSSTWWLLTSICICIYIYISLYVCITIQWAFFFGDRPSFST